VTKRRPPTVWVLTKEYSPHIIGGLGMVATELTKASSAAVKICVVTRSRSRSVRLVKNNRVTVLRIPAHKFHVRGIRTATARYFSTKPDVIHVHSLELARAALWLKRKYRVPILYTCHSLSDTGKGMRQRRRKQQARLIRHAKQVVVPSRWLKNGVRTTFPGSVSKIRVIPHGVHSAARASRTDVHRLLYVGRLLRGKGIEPLIRSVSSLSARNRQVRLTIVGKGSSGYQRRLKALVRRKGIRSRIRWRGFVPHHKLRRLYATHGAVVVPSTKESFCLVALEAMANGIPLVSTRAGGLKEFVNPRNAQIISSITHKGITRAIRTMWKNPKKTRQRIAIARRAAKRYTWRRAAARYSAVYRRLQRQKRRTSKKVTAR
jgi:glycogen(starch) synthase